MAMGDVEGSYGGVQFGVHFAVSDLWPKSFEAFLENFGIIVYCMGFILFLLTQYVGSRSAPERRST